MYTRIMHEHTTSKSIVLYSVRTNFYYAWEYIRRRSAYCGNHPGPLLLTRFNFNPSMDEYYMPDKVWDKITYPFLNFNVCTVEV